MFATTRVPTALVVIVLIVGLASPAAGAVAGASLGETVTDGTDGTGLTDGGAGLSDDGNVATGDETSLTDSDEATGASTDSTGLLGHAGENPDGGTPDSDTTLVGSDDDGLESTLSGSVNGTLVTGGTNETDVATNVSASADAAGSLADGGNAAVSADGGDSIDVNTSVGSDTAAGTIDATVAASTDDGTVTVDADAENTSVTTTVLVRPTTDALSLPASAPENDSADAGNGHAGGTGEENGSQSRDLNADRGATTPPGDAPGSDSESPLGSFPPATPVALLGVTAAGGTIVARSGVTAASVGAVPTPRLDTARLAADWLRAEVPRPVLPFGYSRHDDSDPLDDDRRARLYDLVSAQPGIHLSGLEAETNASLSSVRHHVRILEHEDLVETERIRGRRRLFPAGVDNTALVAALNEPATRAVLRSLVAAEPATVSDLASRLDRDPSTISHHLSRLESDGLVVREREGKSVRTTLAPTARRVLDGEPETPPGASAD